MTAQVGQPSADLRTEVLFVTAGATARSPPLDRRVFRELNGPA
jgi:hypothetical protein